MAALGAVLVVVGLTHRPGEASTTDPGGARLADVPAQTVVPAPPAEVRAPWRPGAPRRLRLPTLAVSAPVVPVRAPGRTLVPPRDPATLGWWADGVRPGGRHGSVLIAGHTVHGAAKGSLEDIGRLVPGAPVVVRTESERLRYVVAHVEVFGKASLAAHAARLFRQQGSPRLVLVTCADWDGSRFLSNVVVIARPSGGAAGGGVE